MPVAKKACGVNKKYFGIVLAQAQVYYVTGINGYLVQTDCFDEMKCEAERFIALNPAVYGRGLTYIINTQDHRIAAHIATPSMPVLPWTQDEPEASSPPSAV
jgi:hypothetical protein